MSRSARGGTWLLLFLAAGCSKAPSPTPAPAEKPHVEADLSRATLTQDQFDSLKIKTEKIAAEDVQEHLACVAFITPKPEDYVTIAAPIAGIVQAVGDGAFPLPGQMVAAGKATLEVQPVVSPLDNIQVATLKRGLESDLNKAKENALVAKHEVERLEELVKQKLRTPQELEEARAKLQHASEDVKSTTDKLGLFKEARGSVALPPMPVLAPRGGEVVTVQVASGQVVAANAPLLTIMSLDDPWLHVQVPEADLERLNPKAPLDVVFPIQPGEKEPKRTKAVPLALIPEVDRLKHTATMLYTLTRPKGLTLAKDQLLIVQAPLKQTAKQSVVPYSAIVFDAYAGAWVYVRLADKEAKKHVFERRRVELGASHGDRVGVRPPLGPSDEVVVDGAGKIFSREFHRPPLPPATKMEVEDDD